MCILSIALLAVGTYLALTPERETIECTFCRRYGAGACQEMGNDDPATCRNVL